MVDDWKDRAAVIMLPGEVVQDDPEPVRVDKTSASFASRGYEASDSLIGKVQAALGLPNDGILGAQTKAAWHMAAAAGCLLLVKNLAPTKVRLPHVGAELEALEERVIITPGRDCLLDRRWEGLIDRGYLRVTDVMSPG